MATKIPFKTFKKIYSQVPRLCVELLVVCPDGVVLTKRDIEPAKGQWHMPGGTVLMGETLHQAITRVMKEELGIAVSIKKQIGVIEYLKFKGYFGHPVAIEYLVTTTKRTFMVDRQASEVGVFKNIPSRSRHCF